MSPVCQKLGPRFPEDERSTGNHAKWPGSSSQGRIVGQFLCSSSPLYTLLWGCHPDNTAGKNLVIWCPSRTADRDMIPRRDTAVGDGGIELMGPVSGPLLPNTRSAVPPKTVSARRFAGENRYHSWAWDPLRWLHEQIPSARIAGRKCSSLRTAAPQSDLRSRSILLLQPDPGGCPVHDCQRPMGGGRLHRAVRRSNRRETRCGAAPNHSPHSLGSLTRHHRPPRIQTSWPGQPETFQCYPGRIAGQIPDYSTTNIRLAMM